MRRSIVALVLLGLLFAACAEAEDSGSNNSAGGDDFTPSAEACDLENPPVFEDGVLTVATDRPAFPPWFEGSPKNYSGYEGEVASEIADRMGLPITWVVEPFNKSYAPGSKDYDFDINQVTATPEREEAVDFSEPYFIDNQGLLALKDNDITDVNTVEDLKEFQLGAQVGTTSLAFINETIQPNSDPKIFDTTNDVKSALESGQIDALITDVVTTVYLRDFEIDGSEVVGQFETGEPFGLLFEQGNPLKGCVDQVIAEMDEDGTLQSLQDEWLQDYLSVPTFQ